MIAADNLLGLVRNTAPFLFDRDWGQHEFLDILRGPLPQEGDTLGYFALCVAAHHSTVATFVPTDVDAKIRGLLWRETKDRDVLRAMADLALRAMHWDLSFVSRRCVNLGLGDVSGHDGERMSIIAGAHGRFLEVGDAEYAEKMAVTLEEELQRELDTFAQAKDPFTVLKLAASIAHNLGDLNQGISFWRKGEITAASRARFLRLGHEDAGRFAKPMRLYRSILSPEGHRNYPLRGVKGLRQAPELLYPQPPLVEDWGGTMATTPLLSFDDRRDLVDALVEGCRKLPGQQGYYRALAGMMNANPSQFERLIDGLPGTSRKEIRSGDFRKLLSVPRASWEASLAKRVRALQ